MNQYGDIIDKETGVETTDDEALTIYRNMVKRMFTLHQQLDGCMLMSGSEHHGPPHVRSTTSGQTEFLHGTKTRFQ